MSKLDEHFAFQIGDTVRFKIHRPGFAQSGTQYKPQILVVVERMLQECYGGIQANYLMRLHLAADNGFSRDAEYSFGLEPVRATEPELIAYEPPVLSETNPRDKS